MGVERDDREEGWRQEEKEGGRRERGAEVRWTDEVVSQE